jgi:hypothetical protein
MKKIDNDEIVLEIPNWGKYNPRKDVKAASWLRLENTLFFDAAFGKLSQLQKLVWIYLLAERSRLDTGLKGESESLAPRLVRVSTSLAARLLPSRKDYVDLAILRLEELQLLKVVSRIAHEPYERNERYERDVRNERFQIAKARDADEIKTHKVKKEKEVSKTIATWESFSNAYAKRYGVEPVRNKLINSQLKKFVERVGEVEAPEVIAYYVSLNDPWYTKQGHSVGILLKDCEKIRTLWATRRQTTAVDAKTSHYQNQFLAIERGEL